LMSPSRSCPNNSGPGMPNIVIIICFPALPFPWFCYALTIGQ
jgi:hypothetical protein